MFLNAGPTGGWFEYGVCTAADEKLWNNPDFMNVIIFDENNIAQGGMHILIIEDMGKKYLTLPGINPSIELLSKVAADDIYSKLISYAQELAKALNCEAVLIPKNKVIHSNRSAIQRIISSKLYPDKINDIEPLTKIHPFSYSPEYSFQSVFVVDNSHSLLPSSLGVSSPISEKVGSADLIVQEDNNLGGIAFNALPIQTESVVGSFSVSGAFKGDLDAEWAQIQAVFNAGIRPSIQRLSEYTLAAAASPLAQEKIDGVRVLLADILRREEEDEKLSSASPAIKELVTQLESNSPPV